MQNKTGTKLPNLKFKTREGHEWVEKTTDDYFKNKKVALFALPGAYTPTCSSTHLPRYSELYDTFLNNGFDDVICLSVNDTFVMNQWQKDQNAGNLTMLPDGNGELTEALGYLVDKSDLGFGKRTWRYSMIVNNGVIEKMFIETEEPGDPFGVSDADTMLKDQGIEIPKSFTIFTREGCQFCVSAKETLKKNNIKFEEHILNKDYSIKTLKAISGTTSVPQIFANGERIGGSDQLEKLFK
jgi:glutaredoxin-like protein